ncbi:MAG: radical SAM family heme chaperone HemW [Dehalococcoidia bacterium]|nr:radical SAM family heme chaperone HemW [Dehalococcoidia bacterium]
MSASPSVGPGHALPLSLYVHIPFCETKCPYCDFNTYAGLETLIPSYLQALQHEITFWGAALGHPQVHTIFLGGGTPSLLALPQLAALMQTIHTAFAVTPDNETTLEANPSDLTLEKLQGYPALGVNRLSIGVQSLDDPLLTILGRRHNALEAVEAYQRARQAGLHNVNLDFIYGISHQSLDTWKATVDRTVALAPEHLSLYALTLESNTPMEVWVRQGVMPEPDPDLAADMYLYAEERLAQAGYEHYEISNWAKPGRESRHNLTYWRNLPYLGVGPGAHSSLHGHRFSVLRSPPEYIRRASLLPAAHPEPVEGRAAPSKRERWGEGNAPAAAGASVGASRSIGTPAPNVIPSAPPVMLNGAKNLTEPWLHSLGILDMVETIGRDLEMGETMMMGLRLAEGVSNQTFTHRFGVTLPDRYAPVIVELQELGLLHWQGERLALTPEGYLLGNEVFQRFVGG